jgi:UDP-2-acetamido-3-amino-2,3-dideoxy-glucuronate N-acetyltransferase
MSRPTTGRPGVVVAASADVDPGASIGEGSAVWQLATVREGARLGERCIVGRGAYIDAGVTMGHDCKVQNNALLYHPAVLGNGVFVGPGACFTNDLYPRAVTPEGVRKSAADWDAVGVTCLEGASIGARAVCVAPLTVGRWAMVAAGSVVVGDVVDFALVVGTPARRVGWVGRAGVPLVPTGEAGTWRCPRTGALHVEVDGLLSESS